MAVPFPYRESPRSFGIALSVLRPGLLDFAYGHVENPVDGTRALRASLTFDEPRHARLRAFDAARDLLPSSWMDA
jgi:hypothetical protein